MDGTKAWLWKARRQRDGDEQLVGDTTVMEQQDGNGRLDCNSDEQLGYRRLGYGRLGNGWHNGLAMDGLTAM